MKLRFFLHFCCLLAVTPVFCNLPMPAPIGQLEQAPPESTPPPPSPPRQQSKTSSAFGSSSVDFDFSGFFKHFEQTYGVGALRVFQESLDARKQAVGLPVQTVPGIPIPCSLAPSHAGTILRYDNPNRIHGSTATYTCETGYTGSDSIIMCTSGTWTTPTINVTCTLVHCGPTPVMQNAHVSVSQLSYGSTAVYTCDPGFQADDIASPIRCQADGQWSSPSFRCTNMMASNQAMAQMASMGGGAGPGMAGMLQQAMGAAGGSSPGGNLNPAIMGAIAQAMGSAQGSGNPGMGAMMGNLASMMAGGGGAPTGDPTAMMSGMPGIGQGLEQAGLPPHLAGLGNMAPLLMPSFMGGGMPGFGQPGVPGMPGSMGPPGGKPLEPEQQQEQMMMAMMMQNMMAQNQRREAQARQLQRQREQQRQQELQRQLQLKQQQQQNSGVNLSKVLAMAAANGKEAPPTANPVQALASAVQQLAGKSGEAGKNDILAALQTIGALANALGQQSSNSTTTESPTAGKTASKPAQPSSASGGSAASNTGASSSSSSSATDKLREAIVAAGLSSTG